MVVVVVSCEFVDVGLLWLSLFVVLLFLRSCLVFCLFLLLFVMVVVVVVACATGVVVAIRVCV